MSLIIYFNKDSKQFKATSVDKIEINRSIVILSIGQIADNAQSNTLITSLLNTAYKIGQENPVQTREDYKG